MVTSQNRLFSAKFESGMVSVPSSSLQLFDSSQFGSLSFSFCNRSTKNSKLNKQQEQQPHKIYSFTESSMYTVAITVAVLMNVSRPTNPFTVKCAFDFNDNVNGSSPDPFQKKSSKRMSCSDECTLPTVFTSATNNAIFDWLINVPKCKLGARQPASQPTNSIYWSLKHCHNKT